MSRHHHRAHNPCRTTLLLSSMALAAGPRLAEAARRRGWKVVSLQENPAPASNSQIVFYGSTLEARAVAERFRLALLEPPLDLLARLPFGLLLRRVQFCRWSDVGNLPGPTFLKPADALDKVFDAGVYRNREQIRLQRPPPPQTPVLVAEPVEWLAEYRCFVLEGAVVASSPYLSFGRPLRHSSGAVPVTPAPVLDVCRRLVALESPALPPAFVVDVGLIEDRGWAIVEFNPAWSANLMSADASPVLDVLRRSCCRLSDLRERDRPWKL